MFDMLAFCQWLQRNSAGAALRESTWGVPALGALHVLALAWFGGGLLVPHLRVLRKWSFAGVLVLLLTGVLLFAVEPMICYRSVSFRIKIALLVLAGLTAWLNRKVPAGISVALWIGIVFAARGIAFF